MAAQSGSPTASPPLDDAPSARQLQGPAPEGSSVIHISLGFGPWAGEYVSWTLDDACHVSDGTWLVAIHEPMSIPTEVSFLAAEATTEFPALGLLSVSFGAPPEMTRYRSSQAADIALKPGGQAAVTDTQATVVLPDGTQEQGRLDATLACAEVVP